MERECHCEIETKEFAREVVSSLVPHDEHATVLGLKGDLGAGKTTFSKYVAEVLGVREVVTSPTFVIEKIYKLEGQKWEHLVHIDAYRLGSGKEMEVLGWDDVIKNPQNLVVVEWPEKIVDVMPKDAHRLSFETVDETTRKITLK